MNLFDDRHNVSSIAARQSHRKLTSLDADFVAAVIGTLTDNFNELVIRLWDDFFGRFPGVDADGTAIIIHFRSRALVQA